MRPSKILIAAVLFAAPLMSARSQGVHSISPYARVGIGTGTLGFDDASVKTVDGGVTLRNRFTLGVEYMDLAGGSESGRWTVGTFAIHLRPTDRRVSPWLAGGAGTATARMPDHESTASFRRSWRYSGTGAHTALGVDIGMARHLFVTPSLSVKTTLGGEAEVQECTNNFSTGVTTCQPWAPESHGFHTLELRIAIGARY